MNKKNRTLLIILFVLILILTSIGIYSYAAEPTYFNGDYEACAESISYGVDKENRNWIYSYDYINNKTKYIVAYSADKFFICEDDILLSHGNQLRKHNLTSGSDILIYRAASTIDAFSQIDNYIYFLSEGNIYKLSKSTNEVVLYINGLNINDFWLVSSDKMQLKTVNKDYNVQLSNGQITETQFDYSSLGTEIMVVSDDSKSVSKVTELVNLREQFPDGKYWNHVGSSVNNPDGYTSRACTHHDSGCNYSGSCGCNSYDSAIQCMGFAFKLGHDVTGTSARKWTEQTSKSSLDTVKAGDIIRYKNDNHSIFVTDVDGDKITYVDCNGNGTCKIRWEQTTYISTIKNSFTSIRICPRDDVGTYTMKLDPGEGTCSQEKIKVKKGEQYGSLPVPEREGYDFLGWYTSETGGSKITETSKVTLGSGATLYAHWKIKTYYVTFDANGGIDAPEQMSKIYMETITLPYRKPSRKGYSFKSWNTSVNGDGVEYKPSAKYSANETVTLFAMWDGDEHRVLFDGNSGSVSVMSMQVKNGLPYGNLPIPTKTGYNFTGWYTAKDGGLLIKNDDLVEIYASQTLYAHWEIKKFTLSFDAMGGNVNPSSKQIEYNSEIGSLPTPAKTGYTFAGWFDKENTPIEETLIYTWIEDKTVYARWKANEYTIRLDPQGGQCSQQSLSVTYDSPIGNIPDPTRPGSKFLGWYTEYGERITSDTKVKTASNITVYAKWLTFSYTTVFNPTGGSCTTGSKVYEYGTKYEDLPTAEKSGFAFEGWYTAENGGQKITTESLMLNAETKTLYARWNQIAEETEITEAEYTVVWKLYSGDVEDKYHPGQIITPPTVNDRQQYAFVGWRESVPSLMPECNIEFNAVYEPIIYPAHYIDGDTIIGVKMYSIETEEPDAPQAPSRIGYNCSWSKYAFAPDGISRNPVYVPIEYTITFVADDKIVSRQNFTVESTKIEEPQVPWKKGYSGRWEDYTLRPENIVVSAKYYCIASIKIESHVHILNVNYRTTVKLWSITEDMPDDAEIHWFINGEDQGKADSDGAYTTEELKRSIRISVGIVQEGKTLVMSDSEEIKVKGGFFRIIVAFFKNLFHNLDYYEQRNTQDIV